MPSSPSGTDPQWGDPATGDATERTAQVRTPGELISLVPYLLGFHPGGGDMVVVGTAPPGNRVRLTLRWDLPGPEAPALAAWRRAAGKESRPYATAECRAIKTAVRAYQAGGSITSHDELARLAVAVTRTPVRDLAWTLMDPAHREAHRRLWTDLARLAGPGLTAAPATLLALCAWQAGNGALAQVALDRALDDDPGYPMARLLRTAVSCAAPPSLAGPALILPRIQSALGSPPGNDA